MAVTLAERSGPPPGEQAPHRAIRLGRLSSPPSPALPSMEKFVIEGGVPLSGTIVPAGNKNGALPIMAACLLTDDEVILRNVPRISDVEAMAALLESLGASVTWLGPGEVSIHAGTVDRVEVDRMLAER